MKKWLIAFACVILMTQNVVANDDVYFDESQNKIFDNANLFTDSEEEELKEMLLSTSLKYNMDIVILTVDDAKGRTAKSYAENFYDTNKFGYEAPYGTGVILNIDMDNREVYIATSGIARVYFDKYIEDILDEVQPPLTDGEYYESAQNFIEEIADYAQAAIDDDNNDEVIDAWNSMDKYDTNSIESFYRDNDLENEPKGFISYLKNPLISGIIAIVVGGIAVLIMSFSGKTKNTVSSKTYMEKGSFNLTRQYDRYTHTTTTKTKVQSSSSGGSGSSGGHSHGGGGRSF